MNRLIFISLFIITACQDVNLDSGTPKKSLISQDQQDDGYSETSDSNIAVEPTSVGGAFLICAHDSFLSSSSSQFGCRIEDESGNKLASFVPQDDDIVAVTFEQTIPAKAIMDKDSFWHWSFVYNEANREAYQVKFLAALPVLANREATVLVAHPHQNDPGSGRSWPRSGSQSPSPSTTLSSHIVFVTSQSYRLGGSGAQQFNSIQMADAKCSQHAKAANLPGSFMALLSDSSVAARDRIKLQGPIKLTDGDIIANMNVFWSTSHAAPIIRDEFANSIGGGTVKVWSGTLATGLAAADEHCNNWSNATGAAKGRYGLGDKADAWISDGQEGCDQSLRLYCINQ